MAVIYHFIHIGFSTLNSSVPVEASRPLAAFTNLTHPQTPASGRGFGCKPQGYKGLELV